MDDIREVYEVYIDENPTSVLEKKGRNKDRVKNLAESFCSFLADRVKESREAEEEESRGETEEAEHPVLKACTNMTTTQKENLYLRLGKAHNADKKDKGKGEAEATPSHSKKTAKGKARAAPSQSKKSADGRAKAAPAQTRSSTEEKAARPIGSDDSDGVAPSSCESGEGRAWSISGRKREAKRPDASPEEYDHPSSQQSGRDQHAQKRAKMRTNPTTPGNENAGQD